MGRLAFARICAARALVVLALALAALPARAAPADIIAAIVGLRAEVPPEARTAETLGREREGTGIVIDDSGLVLTIGYLIVEATAVDLRDKDGRRVPADIVAYDGETGFGLLRPQTPLGVKAVPLGRSGDVRPGDPLLVVSRDGELGGRQVQLAARREFAGYWEYLLPDALFTSPPYPAHSGAALLDARGRLVGVGSLIVNDTAGDGGTAPGNMFVPVSALEPILADLLTLGHRDGPARPWLGVTVGAAGGHVLIGHVAEDSPAAAAGLRPGDMVMSVGPRGVSDLPSFYRALWDLGAAGVRVPLTVRRGPDALTLEAASVDRQRWLRLGQTY